MYVRTSIPVCLLEIDNPSLSHIKLKDISLNSSVNSFRIQLPFVAIILPLHESTWRSVSFEGSSGLLLFCSSPPLLLSSFYPSSGVSVTFCRIIEFLFLFCAGVFQKNLPAPSELWHHPKLHLDSLDCQRLSGGLWHFPDIMTC